MKKILIALFFLLGLMTITASRNSCVYAADGDATGTANDNTNTGGTDQGGSLTGTGQPSGSGTTGDGGTPAQKT